MGQLVSMEETEDSPNEYRDESEITFSEQVEATVTNTVRDETEESQFQALSSHWNDHIAFIEETRATEAKYDALLASLLEDESEKATKLDEYYRSWLKSESSDWAERHRHIEVKVKYRLYITRLHFEAQEWLPLAYELKKWPDVQRVAMYFSSLGYPIYHWCKPYERKMYEQFCEYWVKVGVFAHLRDETRSPDVSRDAANQYLEKNFESFTGLMPLAAAFCMIDGGENHNYNHSMRMKLVLREYGIGWQNDSLIPPGYLLALSFNMHDTFSPEAMIFHKHVAESSASPYDLSILKTLYPMLRDDMTQSRGAISETLINRAKNLLEQAPADEGVDWFERCLEADRGIYDDARLEANIIRVRWPVFLRRFLKVADGWYLRTGKWINVF